MPDRPAIRHASSPLTAVLLAGLGYFLIGRYFPQPADHLRAWRRAAWLASGIVYAAHIGYEHVRLRASPLSTASRTALAVALGAMGLAIAAMMHSLSTTSTIRPIWALALVAWPAITAVPAFLIAFVVATALTYIPRRPERI